MEHDSQHCVLKELKVPQCTIVYNVYALLCYV